MEGVAMHACTPEERKNETTPMYSRSHAWIETAEVATTTTTTTSTHHARSSKPGKKQAEPNIIRPQLQHVAGQQRAKTTRFPIDKKASSAPCICCCAILRVSVRFTSSVLVTSSLLFLSELEVLAARNDELLLRLALLALQPKGHLLRGFGLRLIG